MSVWARVFLGMAVGIAWTVEAEAHLHTESVQYRHGETELEGYLAYDEDSEGLRPGVLVVHEWKGLGPYAKQRAEQLAELGYVAFAVDMYGRGVFAQTHDEAAKLSRAYREDRQLMRDRIAAGLSVLQQLHDVVDPGRIAAIGYCFGGTTVLELARSGADVRGVVSFHGLLDTPNSADAANIKGKVLVFSGADDPLVPPEQIAAFEEEMRQAGVDHRVVTYPGAAHSFTVPEAGDDASTGMGYHAEADADSWQQMQELFETIQW